MRGKPALPLPVHDADRLTLEKLLRRHSTPQNIALRATVLRAAEGQSLSQIAREPDVSHEMSQLWRQQWQQLQPTFRRRIPLRSILYSVTLHAADSKLPLQHCRDSH